MGTSLGRLRRLSGKILLSKLRRSNVESEAFVSNTRIGIIKRVIGDDWSI